MLRRSRSHAIVVSKYQEVYITTLRSGLKTSSITLGVSRPDKDCGLPGTMDTSVVFGFLLTVALVPFTGATERTFTSKSGVEYDTSNGNVSEVSFHFKNGYDKITDHLQEQNSTEIIFQTDATEMLTIYHDSKIVYFTVKQPRPHNETIGYVAMDASREWHTVSLTFQEIEARLEVDGVSYYSYLRKIPQLNKKITIGKDFTGCLNNFTLNGKDIQASEKFNGLKEGCSFPSYLASFNGTDSYLSMSVPTETNSMFLRLSFGFRTFAVPTDLAEFELDSGATIQVRLQAEKTIVVTDGTQPTELTTKVPDLSDGSYHNVSMMVVLGERFDIKIDMKYIYNFTPSDVFNPPAPTGIVGIKLGSNTQNGQGFEGCMRKVLLQLGTASNDTKNFYLSNFTNNNAVIGQCLFKDFCIHEPCAHDTPCTQTKTGHTYSCDCGESGYEGSDCLKPRIVTETCQQANNPSESKIDPDGTGPVPYFLVNCSQDGETMWTEIRTEPEGDVTITENEYPYRKMIKYQNSVTYEQLESLVSRSWECRQMISFSCKDSRLMTTMDGTNIPYGYWEGGSSFKSHYYWGGSNSSSLYKCADGKTCKCDDNDQRPAKDEGYLTTEMDLPVAAVVFNESVDDATDKSATYMVGPLMCRHDRYLDDSSAVTFSGTAALGIESIMGDIPFDISFMFKATVAQGYLIHSEVIKRDGSHDLYFSVEISGKYQLLVTIQSREVYLKSFPVPLDSEIGNGKWQSFYFEMNHNQALVKTSMAEVFIWRTEEFIPNPKLYPTDKIFVGGSPTGTMGFIGCIKNLRILGKYVDLSKHVTDGILKGCVGQCDSSPCLNGGRCKEIGTTFFCDCANTGYTGCYCGKDSSLNVSESKSFTNNIISSTPPEKILQVGFSTQTKDNTFVVLTEEGSGAKLEISIADTGRLSAKVMNGTNIEEKTFDGRVDDNMPHYINFYQRDSQSIIQLDNVNMTFGGKLFPLSAMHTIRIGTTGENLQPNQTYTGCVFSIESGQHKFPLNEGNTGVDSCAPSHVPMGLRAYREGIMKHIHDSEQNISARSAAFIESFSAYRLNNALEEMGSGSVVLSEPVRLVCSASGSPKPRIIWKKNNVVQETDCYHLMTNDSLVLLPNQANHEDKYTCEAINSNGVSRSLNGIEIVKPVSDNTPASQKNSTVSPGQNVSFSCELGTFTIPMAVAVWEKQITQDNVVSSQIIWTGSHDADKRIRVTKDGMLVFAFVLLDDGDSSGSTKFVCYRVNPSTGQRNKATEVRLTVTGAEQTVLPKIVYSTESPVNAMEGDDITLECIGTDYITWYHDGEKMEASDVYGQSLQLKNITEGQAVIYTCKLGDTEEKNITVNVKSYFKCPQKPERVTKTVGEDVVVKCMCNTENYTLQWLGNWKPLPASERYVLDNANTTLTIHNVSKADTQTISCIATVRNISISAEGSLTVTDPLRITSPPRDKVLGDDAVEFCVEVETDALTLPITTFTWKKDNATLANIKPAIETMILSLTKMKNCLKLEGSDRMIGQYTCLVSDPWRSKSASANVFAPQPMTGLTSGAIIGIVVGSIFAITLVAAIVGYVCYKQSRSNRKYGIEGTAGAYKNPTYAN